MSALYHQLLDDQLGVVLWVDFTTQRGQVVNYTVVLLLPTQEGMTATRLYDGAHGFNEMHRYTRQDGKQTGVRFHSGSLSQGMRAAIEDVKRGYVQMIEGWDQ